MKLTTGIAVGALSGSEGGTTASRGKGGQYFRRRAVPTNPNTPAQSAIRTNLANNSARWGSTLTQAQRDGWETFAQNFPITDRLGQSINLSGQAAYVKLNGRLLAASLSVIDTAPTDQSVTDLLTITPTVDVNGSKMEMAYTPTPLDTNDVIIIRATPAFSAGRTYFSNMLRQIFVSSAAAASPADFSTEWLAKFGDFPAAGTKIGFEVNVLRSTNGAYDAVLRSSTIVVDTTP